MRVCIFSRLLMTCAIVLAKFVLLSKWRKLPCVVFYLCVYMFIIFACACFIIGLWAVG
jgi:hypothetical protein